MTQLELFAKYIYTKETCPYPHKIKVDWTKTSPYEAPDHIRSAGGCSEGCCDDFRCIKCGYKFRIECPD